MQREPKPGTPKLNNSRKTRNLTGTPENRRNASQDIAVSNMNRTTNIRHRATMGISDIVNASGLVTKRRLGNSVRLNATLSQAPAQVPIKASELECPENELGLLYDKYLQAKATEIIVKKRIAEKECLMTVQLVAAARERVIVKEKFEKAELRENEIRNATVMQSSIDTQVTELEGCFDYLLKNKVKERLLELKALLEPMDELRCEGIVIPETPDDCREIVKSLEEIGEVLNRIQESCGNKGNTYRDLENALNNLTNKHIEIECVKRKFDEVLCGLQALVLKEASCSLAQNYGDVLNQEFL